MTARPDPGDRHNLGGTELKRLHREWRRRTTGRIALLLDGVQSPFNVGAILRTAAAAGVDHLWLAGDTAPPRGAKTQKTALGTDRYLTWTTCATGVDAARAAHADGYEVIGLELASGAVALPEAALHGDVCLAVGHEDRGLSRELLGACSSIVFIPQVGRVGSLNVATATAIGLYELRRRGWAPENL